MMGAEVKACAAALAAVLCILPVLIPFLRRMKFGQFVRNDGPESHLAKTGTPTMGGLAFLPALPAAMLCAGEFTKEGFLALGLALAMGALGFLDDFLKIRKQHADGLSPRQKMAGQIAAALVFSVLLWQMEGGDFWLPFVGRYVDFGVFYIPAAAFIIVATANGVNFTDGVDGLCAGVTFLVALTFLLLCRVWGLTQIGWFAGALAGVCAAFLAFNIHPAGVFMGDTGALTLGGAVAALALLTGTQALLPLLGIVYVAEVASVILQVGFFRYSGGRRLFRMSPLHHHFELGGWSEMRVDIVFWLATGVAAILFLWILL